MFSAPRINSIAGSRSTGKDPGGAGREPAIYLALGVTVDGERDVLGLWAGEHGDGEGCEVLAAGLLGNQEPRDAGRADGGVRRTQRHAVDRGSCPGDWPPSM